MSEFTIPPMLTTILKLVGLNVSQDDLTALIGRVEEAAKFIADLKEAQERTEASVSDVHAKLNTILKEAQERTEASVSDVHAKLNTILRKLEK